jgi:O-acetyl-ADP-ribose deacetylase (regulator of RNase III)
MIEFKKGSDITTVTSGIIVHGVNCQGVMGSGVALAIRNKWPKVYTEYRDYCHDVEPTDLLGECQVVTVAKGLWVANCFSQLNFGKDGKKYADIRQLRFSLGLAYEDAIRLRTEIHAPQIGAGLGGLDWDEVLPIFEHLNSVTDIKTTIHTL